MDIYTVFLTGRTSLFGRASVDNIARCALMALVLQQAPIYCVAQTAPAPNHSSQAPELEEVIVTAQKRSENLQSVPIAITAISAQMMQSTGVTSTETLSMLTPSLNLTSPAGNLTPFLRGVGTQAAGAGNDASVATYVDGVYMPSMASTMLDFTDVERIEVLKGPQGTLFGRNTTGGVINVVTRDPSFDPSAELRVGYGNFQAAQTSLYATGGITSALAADISLLYLEQNQGWGRNLATGAEVAREGDVAVRSKWRLNAPDDTVYTFTIDYEKTEPANASIDRPFGDSVGIGGVPHTGSFWDVNSNTFPTPTIRQGGASLNVTHPFDGMDLVSITSFRRLSSAVYFDLDLSPVPIVTVGLIEFDSTFTQELQLKSDKDGPFHWIVGAFYLNGLAESDPFDTQGLAFGGPDAYVHLYAWQRTDSISGFAQGTYDFTPDTHLTLGGRITNDRHHFSYDEQSSAGPIVVPDPAEPNNSSTQPSWRASLDHNFGASTLGYVSFNRGFRSGTYNLTDPSNPALRPETLNAYEVGIKTDIFDRRLRVDAAAYDYQLQNMQLVRTTVAAQETLNAAAARIYGTDLELTAVATERLSVRTGLAYTHARYTSFPDAPLTVPIPGGGNELVSGDASGNTMIRTPEYTASVGVDYQQPTPVGAVRLGATYYFNDGWYSDPDNRLFAPSYHLVNATAEWTSDDGRYEVRLWGKNLTNTEYYDHLVEQNTGDIAVQAPPRTYGISLGLKF